MSFRAWPIVGWVGCCLLAAAAWAQDAAPLHERIDALIDAAAVGPLAAPASDADFVRRVHLDLTGLIPTAAEVRAFLADASPDKRLQRIDQLLASPAYARHLALTFDVALMERRPDKAIKLPEWQAYLRRSFAEHKPLDQLFREVLLADGADEALRPAARYLLDRDCEPNLVTRDVGRMLFGMDLQCAQCHDHPTIDDYTQEDYYGLQAFFVRSKLFTDAKKKQAQIAEQADGEASFKSVFTGHSGDRVVPRLPHDATSPPEPAYGKGEEYAVAPAKEVRPVPKYSRRAQLAAMLAESPQFRRNVANRIWALLFERGLVHPVDGHHLANAPSHPEVLDLIAEELARTKFDLRAMLRALAQTRVYQRSCEPPSAAALTAFPAGEQLAALESQRGPLEQRVQERDAAQRQTAAAWQQALAERKQQQLALAPLEAAAKTAREALDKTQAALKAPTEALAKKEQQAAAVAAAAKAAGEAARLLPDDAALSAAAATLTTRATAVQGEADAARQALADLTAQRQAAEAGVRAADEALTKGRAAVAASEGLAALERAALEGERQARRERHLLAALDARIALARAIVDYQATAKSDPTAAAQVWPGLVERWTVAGQVAPLRPLSAEQFALSLLQATGVLAQRQQAAQAAVEKKPPPQVEKAPEAERPGLLAMLAEDQAFEQVRGNVNAFVGLYGTQPGADFQATVNQSLFFENGTLVQGLAGPGGGNLTDRLAQIEDAAALADELYLGVLSRLPTEDERQAVANHFRDRAGDRGAAAAEWVWALLSSNEFRFNH